MSMGTLRMKPQHEHRQARAEAQVDDPQHPGGVQVEGVRQGGQGEHDHLEGHHHGEGAQQIEDLGEAVVHPGDVPGEHGAEDQNGQHRGDGDEGGVEQAEQEALGADGVLIVGQAREGLRVGQVEGSAGADGALHLQGVHEHHEDGVHIDDAHNGHHNAPDPVGAQSFLFHYCCTSLLRVARSWIRAMATTITQKITALAWPMPRHWGPERP